MQKNKVDDAKIIGLLQKELAVLKVKIQEQNDDIKFFSEYQKKFAYNEFAHGIRVFFSQDKRSSKSNLSRCKTAPGSNWDNICFMKVESLPIDNFFPSIDWFYNFWLSSRITTSP